MKIGFSSYCFADTYDKGTWDVRDVIRWAATQNVTHMEIAAYRLGRDLPNEPAFVDELAAVARDAGVPLRSFAADADFNSGDPEMVCAGLFREIDVAQKLSMRWFRHDLFRWAWAPKDEADFKAAVIFLTPYIRRLADYAGERGIGTLVENHGMGFNGPERVLALHAAVDHPNFGILIDAGNFLTVDTDPLQGLKACLPYLRHLHLKDFSIRDTDQGEGWAKTRGGRFIKGQPLGDGDMPIAELIKTAADAGFNGPVTFEIDGPEDDMTAVTRSLAFAAKL